MHIYVKNNIVQIPFLLFRQRNLWVALFLYTGKLDYYFYLFINICIKLKNCIYVYISYIFQFLYNCFYIRLNILYFCCGSGGGNQGLAYSETLLISSVRHPVLCQVHILWSSVPRTFMHVFALNDSLDNSIYWIFWRLNVFLLLILRKLLDRWEIKFNIRFISL